MTSSRSVEAKAKVSNAYNEQETAQLRVVLYKLAAFTIAMAVAPIGSYYLSRDLYFETNTTGAGVTAAVVANLVLAAYVWEAFREDKSTSDADAGKKSQ